MGIWDFLIRENEEKVDREERAYNSSQLNSFLTGRSNEELTEEQVMTIPTAKACRDTIVGSLKDLPIRLYQRQEDGALIEILDDYRLDLLNRAPNDYSSGADFKTSLFNDLLLHGNSYVKVQRKGNKITELWNIPAKDIQISKYVDPSEPYIVKDVEFMISNSANRHLSGKGKTLSIDDVMVCVMNSRDGLAGDGVLAYGSDIFKLALNEINLSTNLMENGSAPNGVLEVPTALTQEAGERLRNSWQSAHGKGASGKIAVLEQGIKYTKTSLTPIELGLTTSRTTTGSEICRIFNMPETLVDTTKNTYGTVEAINIMYIQYCITPLVAVAEDALNRSLLTKAEQTKKGYEFKIDTSGILKSTLKERYEAHAVALDKGFITLNEIRRQEGLKLMEKDMFKMSIGNMLYFYDEGEIVNPNSAATYNIFTKEFSTPELLQDGIKIEGEVDEDKKENQPEKEPTEKEPTEKEVKGDEDDGNSDGNN